MRDDYRIRIATLDDRDTIMTLMERAISQLQSDVLSPEQIASSRAGMGLDTQLIADGTYFLVEESATKDAAGCGGWSRRGTLYGGDHSGGRDTAIVDPGRTAEGGWGRARIRAMYTDPDHVRRGIGRMILSAGEDAARAAGYREIEMGATAAGKPFYERCGYRVERAFMDRQGDVEVPLFVMWRDL